MSAAALALLCLFAAGLLDLLFKLYAAKPRSRGMLIFGIGCVWMVLHVTYIHLSDSTLVLDQETWLYGGAAAIFVTVSNILLLECLGHLPISMASTIYRLNTVPLVILAFIFLNEDLGWLKSLGIAAGLLTVLVLYQPDHQSLRSRQHFAGFLFLIIAASCLRALYGAITKAGLNQGAHADTMIFFAAFGWCIGGILYAWLREHRVVITRAKLKFIPIGGTLVFSIVWLLTYALKLGDASIVVPIANMGFIAAFLFSVVRGMEHLTYRSSSAIVLATISIGLLTVSP